ncbi:unnamed protein product [Ostreobium quekettii]|uniref:RING-type E3 ubiquitin transferase (cysteine targeting) n=1 Tax=Ostreobium quekettii TaxID=121088 RepID=A0A8S1IU49_9CHLO|nr:unnamed protein product [Ostreobium quekettii]|eukprot:evm.model.scf_419EXC.8 EVM.evm.TU.scf_419EXC.8   scf_419EXC:70092-73137(-)
MYGVFGILGPYIWMQLRSYLFDAASGRFGSPSLHASAVNSRLRTLEGVWQVLEFCSALHFLKTGHCRNALELALGMRCAYSDPVMTRTISWEVLNRQLVWHEVSELLLLVLPLLSPQAGRQPQWAYWRRMMSRALSIGPSMGPSAPVPSCPACGTSSMLLPFQAVPCEHVYCYYCLGAHCNKGEFDCLACGSRVLAMKRWIPKVPPSITGPP